MRARVTMSHRELDKLQAIRNVLERKLKQVEAAEILRLSERQVRSLCRRVREEGPRGIVHRSRGRPSNHQSDPWDLELALCALHTPMWHDFGPTFAREKLEIMCGVRLGRETLRKLMTQVGRWEPGRRKRRHRNWRERRQCVGMLVQLDGSTHDWFEGRGPWCVLLVYIDDATSKILYAEFVKVEDTLTLLRTTRTYLRKLGRPGAFYVDRDSIYKINRNRTVEEELKDEEAMTQFTRAMDQLGIHVIPAGSPEAKGRVERGFGTHQDRLIKEMRLRGISTIEEANEYLWEQYIPEHNRRYAVDPASPVDAHHRLLPQHNLNAILAIHTPRVVQNDFTVQFRNRFFQIGLKQDVRLYRKTRITVQERLDGSIRLVCKGQNLRWHEIPGRPLRPAQPRKAKRRHPPRIRPKPDPFYKAFSLKRAPLNPPASAAFQT